MKKKKTTYGVKGMMEYQAVIKVGKNNVSVLFSDGSVSSMGTNPATFTTDNIILQHAIESSADYRNGRIKTIRTVELDEELHIERPKAVVAEPSAAPTARTDEVNEEGADAPAADEEAIAEGQPEGSDGPADEESTADAAITQVEFFCNDDAKDYLEQTFGLVRSKLRNREDIVNAGKSRGVEIIFV